MKAKSTLWMAWGLILAATLATFPAAHAETLYEGDFQVIVTGGLELPYGPLYDAERSWNTVDITAEYEDGTLMAAEVRQIGWNWGALGEYTLTDQFGLQLGIDYRTVDQRISVGGGDYEEVTYATGTLLSLARPFVGASFYAYNENPLVIALTGRVGTVLNGTLHPLVTSMHYYGLTPRSYGVTGATLGGGVSVSCFFDSLIMGGSFFLTNHFLRVSEAIYPDLSETFSVLAADLQAYIGVRF